MQHSPRKKAWVLGAVVIACAAIPTSALLLSEESKGGLEPISLEEQRYRQWIRSISSNEVRALESGLHLLEKHPDLSRLYLRLSELCTRLEVASRCREGLEQAKPHTSRAALYRDAALFALSSQATWEAVTWSEALDPELARWLIDHLRRQRASEGLEQVESDWAAAAAADSTQVGASFGLGYIAALRSDWDRALLHIRRVSVLAPGDAHAFREFGRMYFYTGKYDGFVAAMEAGIENAVRSQDLEHEIVLRGNLGLGYLQWKGDLAKAAEMFEVSLAKARELNMGTSIAIGSYRLANTRARQHRYAEALVLLDSAEVWYERSAPERMSEMHALRGQILQKMYRFSESEAAIQKSLAEARRHKDDLREAQALHALAQLATKVNKFERAFAAADSALLIAKRLGATDYVISTLSLLGEVERLRGRYPDAKQYFSRGLRIADSTQNATRFAELSRELGVTALISGNTEEAKKHFDAAVQALADVGQSLSGAMIWTALTYSFYESYPEAEKAYEAALDSLRGQNPELEGTTKLRLANVKKALGKTDEALSLLAEAEHLLRNDPIRGALVNVVRGQIYLHQEAFQDALASFQQAKSSQGWLAPYWEVHFGVAQALWGLERHDEAEAAFQKAIEDIESKRDDVATTVGRTYFDSDRNLVYDSYAAFLEERGQLANAINVAERARNRSLVDLIYTTQAARANSSGNISAKAIDTVVRSRHVEAERREIRLSSERNSDRADFLDAEQESLNEAYARLETSLRGSQPLYTFSSVTLEDVQHALLPNEVALVFALRDERQFNGARSVMYAVSRGSISSISLDVNLTELTASVDRLNQDIRESRGTKRTGWKHGSRKLYNQLIQPALRLIGPDVTHLHLVPSGPLYYLPFAALQDQNGRYLVEEYTLSVAPSLTILKMCRDRNQRTWRSILVLADPDGDLPGARHEGFLIAGLDSTAHHLAVGTAATQQLLEEQAGRHDVIHLATHGQFRSESPHASHLKLYEDVLSVEEIGRLRLNAYLVTLSACETALSKGVHPSNPAAEEWIGLHQAFLAAGTPTVLASLWTIHDRYSGPLMSRFYSKLMKRGKAEALAEVQRGFIQDKRISHPYFWAGFVAIGDPR